VIVFAAQMLTMILIGLWHGFALHYVMWGAWHGLGLFVHKLFSDRTRGAWLKQRDNVWANRLARAGGAILTFHFVTLGWIFFVIVDPMDGIHFLLRLFGGA
jgi:alginate O-acetyltransferase complex protein AlgI